MTNRPYKPGIAQCVTPGCPCKEFGVRIFRIMRERNFTEADVARAAGRSATCINYFTHGKSLPQYHVALALARGLNVSIAYLLAGVTVDGFIPEFEGSR